MFLCHKCSGLLANRESENVTGLRGCSCISGYYRGFEADLTREQAIGEQVKAAQSRIELYKRQGRSGNNDYSGYEHEWIKKLENLKEAK
jgi:hypothetical protein